MSKLNLFVSGNNNNKSETKGIKMRKDKNVIEAIAEVRHGNDGVELERKLIGTVKLYDRFAKDVYKAGRKVHILNNWKNADDKRAGFDDARRIKEEMFLFDSAIKKLPKADLDSKLKVILVKTKTFRKISWSDPITGEAKSRELKYTNNMLNGSYKNLRRVAYNLSTQIRAAYGVKEGDSLDARDFNEALHLQNIGKAVVEYLKGKDLKDTKEFGIDYIISK